MRGTRTDGAEISMAEGGGGGGFTGAGAERDRGHDTGPYWGGRAAIQDSLSSCHQAPDRPDGSRRAAVAVVLAYGPLVSSPDLPI